MLKPKKFSEIVTKAKESKMPEATPEEQLALINADPELAKVYALQVRMCELLQYRDIKYENRPPEINQQMEDLQKEMETIMGSIQEEMDDAISPDDPINQTDLSDDMTTDDILGLFRYMIYRGALARKKKKEGEYTQGNS
jgi:hypothetical protein